MKKILITILTCFLLPSALTASDDMDELNLTEEQRADIERLMAGFNDAPVLPPRFGAGAPTSQHHDPTIAPQPPQQFNFPQSMLFGAGFPIMQPHQRPHALLHAAAASTLPQPSAVPVAIQRQSASALGGAGSGSKPAVDFDHSTATPAQKTAHWMKKVKWQAVQKNNTTLECGICPFPDCKNKKMIRRHNLQEHIRRHTDDMRHFCAKCTKGFVGTCERKKHEATCKGPATASSGSGSSTVPKKRGAKKISAKIPAVAPTSAKARNATAPMDLSTDHPAAQQILVPPYDLGAGSYAPHTNSQSSMGEQPSTTYSEYSDEQEWSAFDTSGAELPLSPAHHMSPIHESELGNGSGELEFPDLEVAVQDTSTEYSLQELPASAQLSASATSQLPADTHDEDSLRLTASVMVAQHNQGAGSGSGARSAFPSAQPQYVQQPAAQQGAGSGSGTSAASESNTLSPYEASLLFVTERESLDPAILKELLSVPCVAGKHNYNNEMITRSALINALIKKHNKNPICKKCSATFTDWDACFYHSTQHSTKKHTYSRADDVAQPSQLKRISKPSRKISLAISTKPQHESAKPTTITSSMTSAGAGSGSGSSALQPRNNVVDFDYSTATPAQKTAHWMKKVTWQAVQKNNTTLQCGICPIPDCKNKKLALRGDLQTHIRRRHTDDMQHFCDQCKKGFIVNSECISHEATCQGPATASSGSGSSTVPKKRGGKKISAKIPVVAPATPREESGIALMDLSADYPDDAQQVLVAPYDLGAGAGSGNGSSRSTQQDAAQISIKCAECGLKQKVTSIEEHYNYHHRNVQIPSYQWKCDYCSMLFSSERTASHHKSKHKPKMFVADKTQTPKKDPVAQRAMQQDARSGSTPNNDGDQPMSAAGAGAGAGTKRPRTLGMPTADTSAERPAKARRLDKKSDAASVATAAQPQEEE